MFGYCSATYSSVLKYIVNMKLFLHMLVCLCVVVQTADECLWSSYFGVRLMCLELFSGFKFSTVSFVCHEGFCKEFFVLCKMQIWSVVGYAFCVVVCSCLCVMLTFCMNQEFPRMDVSLTSLSSLPLHFVVCDHALLISFCLFVGMLAKRMAGKFTSRSLSC